MHHAIYGGTNLYHRARPPKPLFIGGRGGPKAFWGGLLWNGLSSPEAFAPFAVL